MVFYNNNYISIIECRNCTCAFSKAFLISLFLIKISDRGILTKLGFYNTIGVSHFKLLVIRFLLDRFYTYSVLLLIKGAIYCVILLIVPPHFYRYLKHKLLRNITQKDRIMHQNKMRFYNLDSTL